MYLRAARVATLRLLQVDVAKSGDAKKKETESLPSGHLSKLRAFMSTEDTISAIANQMKIGQDMARLKPVSVERARRCASIVTGHFPVSTAYRKMACHSKSAKKSLEN